VSKINKSDKEALLEEMASVRRLKPDNRHPQPFLKPKARVSPESLATGPGEENTKIHKAGQSSFHIDEYGNPLSYVREGLPRKLLKKMGTRHCPVTDSFDLDGMNENTARKVLERFVAESIAHGMECVRVVHGKGLRSEGPPVLKLMSWKLLRSHPAVLALKPCVPSDGGNGAVLVLLRTNQGKNT